MLINLSYNDIVKKIKEKGIEEEEIEERIKKKLEQLSGLISKEGAAHLVANELGIKVFEDVGEAKIKDVITGMRSVDVVGKVLFNYGVREFKTEKRSGRIANFLIADETGKIRVVVWDDKIIDSLANLKEQDIIRLKGSYVKENSGWKELHLGNRAEIEINPEGIIIENINTSFYNNIGIIKRIKDLSSGDNNVTIRGIIVQMFEPRFFEVCEICGRRAILENNIFKCIEHKSINPKYVAVINFFLDDGSENIRAVIFREQVNKLLEIDENKLISFRDTLEGFDKIKEETLGKQVEVTGRVIRNEMFNRLELIGNNINELNPEKLLEETQNG